MSEFLQANEAALQALKRGETVALATVVRVRGSAPRHAGARILIWPDGRTLGTVGGATLEQRVIEHGLEALRSGHGRFEQYLLTTEDDARSLGLCGGTVEVHIEVLQPRGTLYVIGAGHVAQPLATIAHCLGMRVVVVDDRKEFVTRERFPEADQLAVADYDAAKEQLSSLPVPLTPPCYVVVATWGWDEPALAQVLVQDPLPEYVGLVASRTKARVLGEKLAMQGVPVRAWRKVRAPVGLDLGAETPAEIALSIMAEILMQARSASGGPMNRKRARKAGAG